MKKIFNLQVQCKPYQIIDVMFHKTRTKKKFIWRHKILLIGLWSQDSKAILRKKTKSGRIKLPDLTKLPDLMLQSSKHYGTGTKTENISVEQENNPMQIWLSNLQKGRQCYAKEKRQSLQ